MITLLLLVSFILVDASSYPLKEKATIEQLENEGIRGTRNIRDLKHQQNQITSSWSSLPPPQRLRRKTQFMPPKPELPPENDAENVLFFESIKFNVSISDFNSNVLDGYEQCDDLIQDIEQALKLKANKMIFFNMFTDYWDPIVMETASAIGEDSFGTNNQYDDVDEADMVKSDGTYVYTVYGMEIVVLDLLGNDIYRVNLDTTNEDNNDVNGYMHYTPSLWGGSSIKGLLLHENRLVAFLTTYGSSPTVDFIIFEIDPNTGALSITDRKSFNGGYRAARVIDSNAHVITMATGKLGKLKSVIARSGNHMYFNLNDTEYASLAFAKATEIIPEIATEIAMDITLSETNATLSQDACSQITKLSTYTDDQNDSDFIDLSDSFVSINSFDISLGMRSVNVSATFVPTMYADVYVNRDMVIVGGRSLPHTESTSCTYITAFRLSGASATLDAIGVIPGYTINQFSFDYFDDHLRIATTTNRVLNTTTWEVISDSTSQIIIAKLEENEVKIVGTLEGLGKTETIHAVRFIGPRAFVVTFRQTDPFYAIDLSDPVNPVMRGELKIPGFSNYLHPVEDDYILAVGQDADDNGRRLGLQVALFDVSNLDNPEQIAKHVVHGWSNSASQHDHHAFRYLPLSKKLILPVSWYPTSDIEDFDFEGLLGVSEPIDSFDGFHILDINPHFDGDEDEQGIIDLDFVVAHYDSRQANLNCYGLDSLNPRSLVFAGDLMTLKGHTVLGHNLTSGAMLFKEDLDENLNVTEQEKCYHWWGLSRPGSVVDNENNEIGVIIGEGPDEENNEIGVIIDEGPDDENNETTVIIDEEPDDKLNETVVIIEEETDEEADKFFSKLIAIISAIFPS